MMLLGKMSINNNRQSIQFIKAEISNNFQKRSYE